MTSRCSCSQEQSILVEAAKNIYLLQSKLMQVWLLNKRFHIALWSHTFFMLISFLKRHIKGLTEYFTDRLEIIWGCLQVWGQKNNEKAGNNCVLKNSRDFKFVLQFLTGSTGTALQERDEIMSHNLSEGYPLWLDGSVWNTTIRHTWTMTQTGQDWYPSTLRCGNANLCMSKAKTSQMVYVYNWTSVIMSQNRALCKSNCERRQMIGEKKRKVVDCIYDVLHLHPGWSAPGLSI